MVSLVSRPAQTERFSKTVSVCAQPVNLNKMENALTTPFVKMEVNGMEKLVSEFHATLVLHSTVAATVVKPQFMPAHLVLIGTDQDAFLSQTSVQPV